tara:strand:- start:34 stop:303 length:270 start_codon:yes stop_codon:yes gene_type:complete
LGLTFFGLTSKYRIEIFNQIHDLVYYGKGGFIHSEVYDMPLWLRKFHIQRIVQHIEKQNEEQEKATKGHSPNSKDARGPNIKPSSTYNF